MNSRVKTEKEERQVFTNQLWTSGFAHLFQYVLFLVVVVGVGLGRVGVGVGGWVSMNKIIIKLNLLHE